MDKVMRQVRLAYRAFEKWAASNQLRLFPFRDDLSDYTSLDGKADLRAAINIALLAIPQGMAYAAIAELPILYGIVCLSLIHI